MDDQRALAIVSALAGGANPLTGEIFAIDSLYQSPDIIRALFVAQRALETRMLRHLQPSQEPGQLELEKSEVKTRQPERREQSQAAPRATSGNAGKPWSAEEDKQLLAEFDADKPLPEIARVHGRTVNGVRARLEKHGRLEASAATRWPQERQNAPRPETRGSETRGSDTRDPDTRSQ